MPEHSLERRSWSWSSNSLATWWEELTHWKRPWCWGRLKAGGEGDDRGWDGWMASLTPWTWVWVDSRSWWWTGRPGVLRFMGLQRVGHNWVTELNWTDALLLLFLSIFLLFIFLLWLPWLGFPKLCWQIVMREGTLVFFLILEEMLLDFHHWE